MNLVLIKYILKAAIRDRLILSMLIMMMVFAALSIMMGSAAIIEMDFFSAVYISGSLRIISVLGLVLFISFYVRRLFESKEIEFILSKPVSRLSFVISHAAAFSILSLIITIIVAVVIGVFEFNKINENHFFWVFSLFIELIIIANAALFFSMVLNSASSSVMAAVAFYVLSRMIGQLLSIIYSAQTFAGSEFLGFIMQMISMIIPRLDLMSQTTWLTYGVPEDISFLFIFAHGLLFSALLISASMVDLIRRKF